jgi:hypothetical protein
MCGTNVSLELYFMQGETNMNLRSPICQVTVKCLRRRQIILLREPKINKYRYALVGKEDVSGSGEANMMVSIYYREEHKGDG